MGTGLDSGILQEQEAMAEGQAGPSQHIGRTHGRRTSWTQ